MIRLVGVFLIAAIISAIFGYGALGGYAWPGARNFFYFFLMLAGLTVVIGSGILKKSG